ncbi:lipopolysaccharide biosynthesis protein [Butyrivibrio sp. XPD2006]|uniref:lipopolysaccharide biosynthesis protein n=1 Tax=Butyrivibrio sp. XPD2006 TaxID=1280668 RepID=UPI0003B5932F|nr:hypothetical protein [Butyrivibrio sp. XPD2006]
MGDKKSMAINMVSQFVSFAIGLVISFVLTRHIARLVGKDVYGFVGLANTFTSYVTVFTVALNSMLNRYVTIAFQRKEYEKASSYFSSVVIANTVLSVILAIPAAGMIIFIDKIFDVPVSHITDIKLLWLFIFVNFLFGLSASGYGTCTYATNRLDMSARRSVEANIIKAIILVVAYAFFTPKVWYLGLSIFVCGMYSVVTNIRYKKILTPQIQLKAAYFKFKSIGELVGTGIWSSFNQLTQTLINGLDLVFANKFLGALEMSLMSYSKTVPVQILALVGMVSGVFGPKMTILYAEGDMERFKKNVNSALKLCGFICSIPIVGFIVFGGPFFKLWLVMLTEEEIRLTQLLSILTLLPTLFSVYIYPLYTVNSITRKLKVPVLVSFGIGLANVIIVPILLKYTSLGLIAIKTVSSVLLTLRVLFFVPLYAAYSLKMKWHTFYPALVRGTIGSAILLAIFSYVNSVIDINTWMKLIVACLLCGGFGYIVNYFVLLSKDERDIVHDIVSRKMPKLSFKK